MQNLKGESEEKWERALLEDNFFLKNPNEIKYINFG